MKKKIQSRFPVKFQSIDYKRIYLISLCFKISTIAAHDLSISLQASVNTIHTTVKENLRLSYNLSGLANQNQALRQNTSQYFISKMSLFNTSRVLYNSQVMLVYVIIVHYC